MIKRIGLLTCLLSAAAVFLPAAAQAQDWGNHRDGYHYYGDRDHDRARDRDWREHERREWRDREWREHEWREHERWEDRRAYDRNYYYQAPGYGSYYSPGYRYPY